MNKQEYLEELRTNIEINKKNAIEEMSKEEMVPAMWSVIEMMNLKERETALKMFEKE